MISVSQLIHQLTKVYFTAKCTVIGPPFMGCAFEPTNLAVIGSCPHLFLRMHDEIRCDWTLISDRFSEKSQTCTTYRELIKAPSIFLIDIPPHITSCLFSVFDKYLSRPPNMSCQWDTVCSSMCL